MSFSALKAEVKRYFEPFIAMEENGVRFLYNTATETVKHESWTENGVRVPISEGVWLASHSLPVSVSNLFIAYSASNILCFLHFYPKWLAPTCSAAFAALGVLPSRPQIDYLSSLFPNAKFHTLFDNGLTGRVADCKVAAWRCGRDVKFELQRNRLSCALNSREFVISENKFSLSCFEGIAGIRSSAKACKPKPTFDTYVESFIAGASQV